MSWEPSPVQFDPLIVVDGAPVVNGVDTADLGFLKGLVQGMRCGIVTVDVEGRLRLVNQVAREILELQDAPTGAPLAEALSHHPQLIQALTEAFSLSTLPNRAEIELGEAGAGKTIGFTLSLVRSSNGESCGVAMFFKDLTQIEHNEEQERLKDRLAALGQMAASLAHEIRNPLASIEVTCSLIKRRLREDERGVELLDKIVAEVRRLNSTVTSSLEYVRPVALTLECARILPLLEEAISVAVDRRGRPGITIERSFPDDIGSFLMDPALLRQVFENLVLNALEAVGDEGVVALSAEVIDAPSEATVPYRPAGASTVDPWPRAEQFVVVRVCDTGPGVDEEDLDRIFYPLFTTKKQGSGIGLAVVRKIVNSHRGLIDVESAPGGGAEFSIRLPMPLPSAEVPGR